MTARVLPVGVFVTLFREALEADPLYADLWLEGEVTDFSRSAAGHVYFTLRDEIGSLKCVLFRNQALRQHQLPNLGSQVAVHGGLSLYPRSGAVQLIVDLVRPAGLGAAWLELEYLRQRLEAEGLFDVQRKRALPAWPRTIGVVTSASGAAWHDIQSVIRRRFPLTALLLSPARVQGDGAAESIVAALEALQRDDRIDLVILARGGGAADDLAAFNDDRVVRAVFACRVPLVAGVGHAIDRTLVEDVADAYAPTPSAAAEIVVPSVTDLADQVASLHVRLAVAFEAHHTRALLASRLASQRIAAVSPQQSARVQRLTVDASTQRLRGAVDDHVAARKRDAAAASALLMALEPAAVLRRGYAALQTATGTPLFSVAQTGHGARVVAILEDGSLTSVVDRVETQVPAVLESPR
jgi:exodeoxyribonuclease VII large subunit